MASQSIRLAIIAGVGLLAGGGVYLWLVRGPAMLLDLAVSAAAFLCL